MVDAVRYRVGQFFRALFVRIPEEEVAQATRVLTPAAQELFHRQSPQDQRHALAVYRTLYRAGHLNSHLLAAALLHDVGKAAARLPAWQRAVIVLANRFAPRLLNRLSQGEPNGWRRPFVVQAHHPELGSQWADEAGCSPLTVALIRRHQEPRRGLVQTIEEDRMLALLQTADSAC